MFKAHMKAISFDTTALTVFQRKQGELTSVWFECQVKGWYENNAMKGSRKKTNK